MSNIELEFVKSIVSEGYIFLLESGRYNLALTLYKAEKLHFKHALNLVMHYFKERARVYKNFKCTEEVGFSFFLLHDQYYNHCDIKIAFYLEEMNKVGVWIKDNLAFSFMFTIADEGYDLSEWLTIIADKIVELHQSFQLEGKIC